MNYDKSFTVDDMSNSGIGLRSISANRGIMLTTTTWYTRG